MSEQQNPLTCGGVLEMFRQTDLRIATMHAGSGRWRAEAEQQFRTEMEQQFQETKQIFQETDRQMKETNKKISAFASRIGEIIENMVSGNIVAKFQALGHEMIQCGRRVEFKNKRLELFGEIDLFLENGNIAILIEVKTTLEPADVRRHIERLEKYRKHADSRGDKCCFVGAVAGAVVFDGATQFAHENGMYVIILIILSGKAVEIMPRCLKGFRKKTVP